MLSLLIPIAHASGSATVDTTSLQTLVSALVGLANSIIPLLLAVAVIVFIWGVVHFLAHPDDEAERKNMKGFLLMSVIAIAVILSIWGLATGLKDTLFPSAPCPVGVSGCTAADTSNPALPIAGSDTANPAPYTNPTNGVPTSQSDTPVGPTNEGKGITAPPSDSNAAFPLGTPGSADLNS